MTRRFSVIHAGRIKIVFADTAEQARMLAAPLFGLSYDTVREHNAKVTGKPAAPVHLQVEEENTNVDWHTVRKNQVNDKDE